MTATVPLWATLAIAFGVALITLVGVLVTQWVVRRNAKDTIGQVRQGSLDQLADKQAERKHDMLMKAMAMVDATVPESIGLFLAILRVQANQKGISAEKAAYLTELALQITGSQPLRERARSVKKSERVWRIVQRSNDE